MLQHGLIHLANIIYLASYAVKDMRVLRWLTVLGIVLLIPYYLVWELWAAAVWNGIFLGINLYRIFTFKPQTSATHSRAAVAPLHHHEKSSPVSLPPPSMCPEGDSRSLGFGSPT